MVLQGDVLPGWPGRQVSSEVPILVVLGMGVSNDKEECCQFSGASLWFTEEGISPDSHILKDLLINREAKNGSLVFGLCEWPRTRAPWHRGHESSLMKTGAMAAGHWDLSHFT